MPRARFPFRDPSTRAGPLVALQPAARRGCVDSPLTERRQPPIPERRVGSDLTLSPRRRDDHYLRTPDRGCRRKALLQIATANGASGRASGRIPARPGGQSSAHSCRSASRRYPLRHNPGSQHQRLAGDALREFRVGRLDYGQEADLDCRRVHAGFSSANWMALSSSANTLPVPLM